MNLLILISGLFLSSCSVSSGPGFDENVRYFQVVKEEGDNQAVSEGGRVWVFKYDGSLQCETGHAIPLEKMKEELKNIDIYDAKKKSDGLMRVQMCGSPTGFANVYQINRNDLEEAKEKGFELWAFN